MPLRLTSPTVGLMPTSEHAADGRRDRAIGLRADGDGAVVRRHGDRRARARARRRAIERIRIARLSAARRPAARRVRRAEVRPLAEVRLAEDDRARRAQPLDDERVARRARPVERERAGGGGHAVRGVDVVLHEHRDAVQRTAHLARAFARRRARRRWRARRGSSRSRHAASARCRSIDVDALRGTARRAACDVSSPRASAACSSAIERSSSSSDVVRCDGRVACRRGCERSDAARRARRRRNESPRRRIRGGARRVRRMRASAWSWAGGGRSRAIGSVGNGCEPMLDQPRHRVSDASHSGNATCLTLGRNGARRRSRRTAP